jgi:hypothetical protein
MMRRPWRVEGYDLHIHDLRRTMKCPELLPVAVF